MGFSNRGERGERGKTGVGFSLTTDNHYHIRDKRLTNVSAPVEEHDATTKKFVTDLLIGKAGTIYVGWYYLKYCSRSLSNKEPLYISVQKHDVTEHNLCWFFVDVPSLPFFFGGWVRLHVGYS